MSKAKRIYRDLTKEERERVNEARRLENTPEGRLLAEILANENIPNVNAGWYVIYPEGCSWVAVKIGEKGIPTVLGLIEEHNAETHIKAQDHYSSVCQAINDGKTKEVSDEIAIAVVEAYDDFAEIGINPTSCVVDRVL